MTRPEEKARDVPTPWKRGRRPGLKAPTAGLNCPDPAPGLEGQVVVLAVEGLGEVVEGLILLRGGAAAPTFGAL